MNSELLTIDDVCKELGIGKNTAYKLAKNGSLRFLKIGRRMIVRRQDLDAYINLLAEDQNSI